MKNLYYKYKLRGMMIRVVNNDNDGFYLYNESWQFLYKAKNTAAALEWIGADYQPADEHIHAHQD